MRFLNVAQKMLKCLFNNQRSFVADVMLHLYLYIHIQATKYCGFVSQQKSEVEYRDVSLQHLSFIQGRSFCTD